MSAEYSNVYNVPWARLAQVQIVAEVYDVGPDGSRREDWKQDPSAVARVLDALRQTGALAVVTGAEAPIAGGNWQPIGSTRYRIHFLNAP